MRLFLIIVFFNACGLTQAQLPNPTLKAKNNTIQEGETYELVLTIFGDANPEFSFPQIEGFVKRNRKVQKLKVELNEENVVKTIYSQIYNPTVIGDFVTPEFKIRINQRNLTFEPLRIKVIPKEEVLMDKNEFLSKNENAEVFIFLFADKSSVYIGEGVQVELGLYVSENNSSNLQFPQNLSDQIAKIQETLEPKNCLISRATISQITEQNSTLKNLNYKKYTLYKSVIYPLNDTEILLPSVTFDMLLDSTETIQLSSKPFRVSIKENQGSINYSKFPVGVMDLDFSYPSNIEAGKIFQLKGILRGRANMRVVQLNTPSNSNYFTFYPPNQTTYQAGGNSFGRKEFLFKVLPKDTGLVNIGNYFQLVSFNPITEKLDTIKVDKFIKIEGLPMSISELELGIYAGIEKKATEDKSVNIRALFKNFANILLILMLVGTLFITSWRKNG